VKLWLIYTDLDGTLLDADTYSFKAARTAIRYLQQKGYPVIPCTSKTHPEVDILRSEAELKDPFITENGSAVFYSKNFFPDTTNAINYSKSLSAHILGKKYDDVLTFLKKIRTRFNIPLKGFHEMEITAIARLTGLSISKAHLAGKRFFSEPFILTKPFVFDEEVFIFIKDNGFRLLRGNRFFHLLGDSDKGRSVITLTEMYQKKYPGTQINTMAIGDSKNDIEMLKVVDCPVVVKKKSAGYLDASAIENVYYCQNDGPEGWAEAVYKFILT